MKPSLVIEEFVSIGDKTTLKLGGKARYFFVAKNDADIVDALKWARSRNIPVYCLGGGSNVVISDQGVDGLLLMIGSLGRTYSQVGDKVLLTVQAGEIWDEVVEDTVRQGFSGLECLSGIPGRCGAAPIQNVGAYGQEVAQTLKSVRVIHRATLEISSIENNDCQFGYRTSLFKEFPETYIILSVTFLLSKTLPKIPVYQELAQALSWTLAPTLSEIRETVLSLRRKKSMVLDNNDENRRSVGSFFLNPIVPRLLAHKISSYACVQGIISEEKQMPCYPFSEDKVKLSAAWLIEKAGISRGTRYGAFGISTNHSLCIVHHGGGTSAHLLEVVSLIQTTVFRVFGVFLRPEPNFLGFSKEQLVPLFS